MLKKRPVIGVSLFAICLIVALNLFNAWVLESASSFSLISIQALSLIGLVILIGGGRFVLWGWLHKRVDLSKSYPLTAVFYPMIAVLSIIKGENVLLIQWLGIILITAGVAWMCLFVGDRTVD